jgi:threonine/homoserine/homoserine lactone efflux protein
LPSPGPTNALFAASGAGVGLRKSLRLAIAAIAGYLLAIFVLLRLAGAGLVLNVFASVMAGSAIGALP